MVGKSPAVIMNSASEITYYTREKIDDKKWDACLAQSANGLIYGSCHYLDAMCSNWDALVLNNYEAVMPLPWRKKWTIRYLYQPAFIQQTGIFSLQPLTPSLIENFLVQARRNFAYGELNLNAISPSTWHLCRNNFILPLNKTYSDISAGYSGDLRKNLKEAKKHLLSYTENLQQEDIIGWYQEMFQGRMGFESSDYENLEILIRFLENTRQVVTRTVIHQQKMVSAAICLKDAGRLYLLISVTNETGRKVSAGHFLMDAIIKEFSGRPLVLDFEGSDQEGIAHFYKNFGAENQPYYFTGWNRLPWPFRHFKPMYRDE